MNGRWSALAVGFSLLISMTAKAAGCLDVPKWVQACKVRIDAGTATLTNKTVDIRFPGLTGVPTDKWVKNNAKNVLEESIKPEGLFKLAQEECKALKSTDADAVQLLIEKSGENFVETRVDPLSPGLGGFASLVLSELSVRLEAKNESNLVMSFRNVQDSKYVETESVFHCGMPEEVSVGATVTALKNRLEQITASGMEPADDNGQEFGAIDKAGNVIYVEGTKKTRQEQMKAMFHEYLTAKGLNPENLGNEGIALSLQWLKEKNSQIPVALRIEAMREMQVARVFLSPEKTEQITEEAFAKLAEHRKTMGLIQKEVASQLSLPDSYWNYPDVPNKLLSQFAEAFGQGLAQMAGQVGQALGEAIPQALGQGLQGGNPPEATPNPNPMP